jgi:hypothetical protein
VAKLPFPKSLPDFQRLFPNDAACAEYLEKTRWEDGFICPSCNVKAEPFRFDARPGVLRCRSCRKDASLTAGTVMERTHTPLSTWFWGAYLMVSMTPGVSAVQFQRQLGLSRYETAFQILHKLRAGMVRPDQDRIGGAKSAASHVEVDEAWVGGKTKGQGRGVHHQALVVGAVEACRKAPVPAGKAAPRRGGRYAGRLRLSVAENRTRKALGGFVEASVAPGAMIVTDDWSAYDKLSERGYQHLAVPERGDGQVAEEYLPLIHLVFSNLKAWIDGTHHGRIEAQHLQAYLNEFTFRFNRRFWPFNAFRSLLGIAGGQSAPTYAELYSGEWEHPNLANGN